MIFLLGVSLADQHTSKKCLGCKEDSESQWNVTLEISSLRVIIKRRGGKKQREETDNQQHVIMTEKILFKGLTTKGIRNYNRK